MTVMIGIALVIMIIFAFLFFFSLTVGISEVTLLTASGLVGGFFIAFGDAENILILIILGWLLVAAAIIGFIVCHNNEKEVTKIAAKEESVRIAACEIFYKCREKSVNIESDDGLKTLLMISKSYGIDDVEKAKEYYFDGKCLVELYEKNEAVKAKVKKIIPIFIVSILFIFVIANAFGNIGKDSERWNSLSDEEKEWYRDNFGDGQYDEIQDAISDYRGY